MKKGHYYEIDYDTTISYVRYIVEYRMKRGSSYWVRLIFPITFKSFTVKLLKSRCKIIREVPEHEAILYLLESYC